jgi:hypothetical protein
MTRPKTETELQNLVYGVTAIPHEADAPWYKRPGPLAIIVLAVLVIFNILFW